MCAFCDIEKAIDKDRILLNSEDWIIIYDNYPVSKGHVIIISKEHYETYFDLTDRLKNMLSHKINYVKFILDKKFNPDGYNIGCNCGEAAGQTINHFHLHVIPRYKGDCENPRGGVRGCIPNKMSY